MKYINYLDYRLITSFILCSIFMIGLYIIWKRKRENTNNIKFAQEFLTNLQQFCKSHGKDRVVYSWLINRSPKMQSIMGHFGLLSSYQPAFKNIVYNNYQIISNMIPELNKEFYDLSMTTSRTINIISDTIQESIVRYIGNSEDINDNTIKAMKNPIIWFREGVTSIILIPIYILYWFGLISKHILITSSRNIFIKFITFIISFVGFFSSIITIIIGWSSFITFVKNIF